MATKRPGVEEGVSYGTPALRVRKKLIARLKEDGKSVAIRVDRFDRDVLLDLDPAAFYLTDHYRSYPMMLVRLKQVRLDLLEQILDLAWRRQAPKSLLVVARRMAAAASARKAGRRPVSGRKAAGR